MAEAPSRTAEFAGELVTPDAAPPAREDDVSVAGVLLLSASAVLLAILSVVMLGLLVLGAWWVVSHIPVPVALTHLLALLHLT